jgi:glycosyltransferase involved in cell wall biosynthesis
MNILHISPDFNYSCGVSKHVYICLKNLSTDSTNKLFFITNKGDSLDRLKDITGLNFTLMSFEKDHKNIFRLIYDFFRLLSFCNKNKIDIIHTHHRYPELLAVLVSKFTGIKTVTTVHSFVKSLNVISFRSQEIIAVSNAVQHHVENNFTHTVGRITTLYNCIEESFYENDESDSQELRESLGYVESDKILLFAGRISEIKGTHILIEAFKKLTQELNAKLLIVGSVTDIKLKSIMEVNGSKAKILEPQKDLKPYYRISDLVILPSIEDPFPYVMLEAGAMKKPFIGGDTGGIHEFIVDNINGFLVKPGDSEELSHKIDFVLRNPHITKAAGIALNEKVRQFCDCKKYYSELKRIYRN